MPAWAWASSWAACRATSIAPTRRDSPSPALTSPGYAQFAEAPEKGAVNVAAYEFPLWVAASFSTVAEVRKALKDVVIVAKAPARAMAWPSCTGW